MFVYNLSLYHKTWQTLSFEDFLFCFADGGLLQGVLESTQLFILIVRKPFLPLSHIPYQVFSTATEKSNFSMAIPGNVIFYILYINYK